MGMSSHAGGEQRPEGVLRLTGDLDFRVVDTTRAALLQALEQACERLVVDLSAVDFIDSSGLAVLHEAARHADQHGMRLDELGQAFCEHGNPCEGDGRRASGRGLSVGGARKRNRPGALADLIVARRGTGRIALAVPWPPRFVAPVHVAGSSWLPDRGSTRAGRRAGRRGNGLGR